MDQFELPGTSPYLANSMNGRVNLQAKPSAGGAISESFPGFQHQTSSESDFQKDMLRGNWEATPVSKVFFSAENMKQIQSLIRKEVYNKSHPKGYVIDDQSADELKIIMRAIYLQYCRNLPTNITGQVGELNTLVANWSVPHILSAVDHYMYYLDDISHLPIPMVQPVNVSRAGVKTLPTNQFM
jgi:hypothetical protein